MMFCYVCTHANIVLYGIVRFVKRKKIDKCNQGEEEEDGEKKSPTEKESNSLQLIWHIQNRSVSHCFQKYNRLLVNNSQHSSVSLNFSFLIIFGIVIDPIYIFIRTDQSLT